MEPWVVASRCGEYRSLFDRRSGLVARYLKEGIFPWPETLEVEVVGEGGGLLDLEGLRDLLSDAPLCRNVLLCGDVAAHPALPSILRIIRDHGVVPTVVFGKTRPRPVVLDALQRWCGAAGIDAGLDLKGTDLLAHLRYSGLRLHLHLPVADSSVERITRVLRKNAIPREVRAVVLAGRTETGAGGRPTGLSDTKEFKELVDVATQSFGFRVACDARLGPLFTSHRGQDLSTLAVCEAGRSSLFISHALDVAPCSLLTESRLGSLQSQTLKEIWAGPRLSQFRRAGADQMPCACEVWELCRGGCPAAARLCKPREDAPLKKDYAPVDLRFGFATSSLCDRAFFPLSRQETIRTVSAIHGWSSLRFFNDEPSPQVAAAWSRLEHFLSLPAMWGQDLARLHEQLVAGTVERLVVNP